ncbi:MAG TPA: hypothetical protein VIU37_05775, partial [Candidatus Limnocylindrales bacterium]
PRAVNRYLPVGGPAPVSIRDTIGIFERLLGQKVAQRGVAPGTPIPGLPPLMAELLAMLDAHEAPIEMAATAVEFGVRLTSVEAWASELVPVVAR